MRTSLRKLVPLPLTLAVGASLLAFSPPAAGAPLEPELRPVEQLTRGLVAAQTAGGVFLSWRFLGDEPEGISWNVYRKDGAADLRRLPPLHRVTSSPRAPTRATPAS